MNTFKLILGASLIVGMIYGAWMVIPPYFANYQFEDALKNAAMNATYSTKTDDDVRNLVFKQAKDLDLPVTKEQIKIQHSMSSGSPTVAIEVEYSVHVDLPGYPLDLHFHPATQNKSIY